MNSYLSLQIFIIIIGILNGAKNLVLFIPQKYGKMYNFMIGLFMIYPIIFAAIPNERG